MLLACDSGEGIERFAFTICSTHTRRSRSTAAGGYTSSLVCPAMSTSRPPSAMRTLPRVPCSMPQTECCAALPPCSTAGRRADGQACEKVAGTRYLFSLPADADEVCPRVRRAALASVEAVHGRGNQLLPQERHSCPRTDDLAKLGAVLRLREDEKPICVAAVRLLLLTGCRPEEIRRLRWFKPDRFDPD